MKIQFKNVSINVGPKEKGVVYQKAKKEHYVLLFKALFGGFKWNFFTVLFLFVVFLMRPSSLRHVQHMTVTVSVIIGSLLALCFFAYGVIRARRALRNDNKLEATPQTSTNPFAPPRDDSGKPSP